MGLMRRIGNRRLVAMGGVIGALALLLGWSLTMNFKADAHTPHPGLNFTIEAVGQQGCDTSNGDHTCYIPPGTRFTLNVVLEDLPNDIPSYEGYDVVLNYTGLSSADDATTAMWPECGFPAQFYAAGKVAFGCTIGLPPAGPSTYTGIIGTNTFTCTNSGTISLPAGDGNTILTETLGTQHAEGAGSSETLNITCGSPPPPTATPGPAVPTALPGTGTGGVDQGNGGDAVLWITIGVLLIVGLAGLATFGRRINRVAR
jgi:hypothetical protein